MVQHSDNTDDDDVWRYTRTHACMHAHTHPFNSPFSGSTQVSQHQKGNTNLDSNEARDSEWQWHQLGHMQVCTPLQTGNHASAPPLSFFTGQTPFLPPNHERQCTEGTCGDACPQNNCSFHGGSRSQSPNRLHRPVHGVGPAASPDPPSVPVPN